MWLGHLRPGRGGTTSGATIEPGVTDLVPEIRRRGDRVLGHSAAGSAVAAAAAHRARVVFVDTDPLSERVSPRGFVAAQASEWITGA